MKKIILAILLVGSFVLVGCGTPEKATKVTVVSTSVQKTYSEGRFGEMETDYYYVTFRKNGDTITLHTDDDGMYSMLTKGDTYDVTYNLDDGTLEQVTPINFVN